MCDQHPDQSCGWLEDGHELPEELKPLLWPQIDDDSPQAWYLSGFEPLLRSGLLGPVSLLPLKRGSNNLEWSPTGVTPITTDFQGGFTLARRTAHFYSRGVSRAGKNKAERKAQKRWA